MNTFNSINFYFLYPLVADDIKGEIISNTNPQDDTLTLALLAATFVVCS